MANHLVLHWLSDGDGPTRVGLAHRDAHGLRPPVAWTRHPIDREAAAVERRALQAGLAKAVAGRGLQGLVAHGRALFDLALPAAVKARLRQASGRLTVITDDPGLPWPLLHDGADWLGLRWAMGTVPAADRVAPAPATPPAGDRLLVVADPAGDLEAARNEGEALMRQLARAGDGLACDLRLGHLARQDFLRLFRGFRLVHFAGHADPGAGGEAGWRFADGHLHPSGLAQLAGGGAPGLVFANACRSVSSQTGDLVEALLAVGVRHVIGTAVDLPDLPGATFAARFYAGLRAGLSVGDAVQGARARAAEAGDPVWAAYRLFGAPEAVYFQRRAATELAGGPRPGVVVAVRLPPPAAQDPEAFADARQAARGALRALVAAEGGRLLPGRGAVDRAVFGAPISFENDAERASRAALAARGRWPAGRVVVEAGRLLPVGVDVLGPAADAAEAAVWRLPPGVFALPGAVRALRGRARLGPEAEGAHALLGLGAEDGRPPLVGRHEELGRLRALLQRARAGQGAAVTVLGPAGIGKSRLVEALLDEAPGAVLRGAAVAYDEAHPFAAAAGVVRGLIGVEAAAPVEAQAQALAHWIKTMDRGEALLDLDDILSIDALVAGDLPGSLAAQQPALEVALGLRAGDGLGPGEVPAAVARAVAMAARQAPRAVWVEDVHWLPPAGQAVVAAMVEAAADAPLLVVATARPELQAQPPAWWSTAGHERLPLGPLEGAAADALLAQVLPANATPAERATLAARAEGNPLFLRELGLARAGGAEDIPLGIEGVVRARVDRLHPELRAVLRAAAVVGRTFWRAAVEALLDKASGLQDALAALARRRFIVKLATSDLPGEEAWRFQHALVHEVVYGGTQQRSRVAWHGRAALWLAEELQGDASDRWARIAGHRDAAGDHSRAAEAWLEAAAKLGADVAPAETRKALEAALAADDRAAGALSPLVRADAEARLAQVLKAAGQPDAARAQLQAALARTPADAPVEAARWRLALADLAEAAGAPDTARAHLAAGLAGLEGVAGPAAGKVRALLRRDESWLAYRDGDYEAAVALGQAAMAELPAEAHLEGAGVANVLGVIHYGKGDDDAAGRYYRRARAGYERAGRGLRVAVVDNNLGILAMRQGDFDEAADRLKRAVRQLAVAGDRDALARTYNNLGTLYGERGDYPKAARYLQESIAFRSKIGHAGLALGLANLGEVWLKLGRHAEARARLDEAIALCEAGKGPGYLLPDAWRMRAELHLAEGDAGHARAAAERAVGLADQSGDAPRAGVARRVLGQALAAAGDRQGALDALEAAVEALEQLDQPVALAQTLEAQAAVLEAEAPARAAACRAEARRLNAAVQRAP